MPGDEVALQAPVDFTRPREHRTSGFDIRSLHQGGVQKRPRAFPLSAEELGPHKKTRFGSESKVLLAKDYKAPDDADLSFISPDTDPKTLCPYCDAKLPEQLSEHLRALLARAFLNSNADSRPANPLGRKAPMMAFAALCQRHRFETTTMPIAIAAGWPITIDWGKLEDRITKMQGDLGCILADVGGPLDFGASEGSVLTNGARTQCIFWQELLVRLKASGSRRVTGVSGQFSSFKNVQPGYYGEMGTVIIHRTLYKLFPPSTISLDAVAPVTAADFIGCILVPEVGMRLIVDDMSLDVHSPDGRSKAVAVMRASADYGVSMFPYVDEDF
ncbi:RTC4-like domain-containing protein [Mycena belliarum]|uniref:Restriction of telomere capping protein 4 n=1 Tax=Mycena belliarum TaxID=1033014 RepID=A0AAD6XQA4_9AGAR|nr:RTC4-like domain-containing protein [Mycena belliae]